MYKSREFPQRILPTLTKPFFPLRQDFRVSFIELENHQQSTWAILTNSSITPGKSSPILAWAHCSNPQRKSRLPSTNPWHNTCTKLHLPVQRNALTKLQDQTTVDQNTARASSIIRKELKTSSVGSAVCSNRMEKYPSKRQIAKLQDDVKNILGNCLPRDYRNAVRSYTEENHAEVVSL